MVVTAEAHAKVREMRDINLKDQKTNKMLQTKVQDTKEKVAKYAMFSKEEKQR